MWCELNGELWSDIFVWCTGGSSIPILGANSGPHIQIEVTTHILFLLLQEYIYS